MPIEAPIHTNEINLPRVLQAGLPVLLVFWRRECAPCEQLASALERLAKAYAGRALIAKINVTDEPGLVQRYAVDQLPALLFFKDGQLLARGAGAAGERELIGWLDYLTRGGPRPAPPSGPSVPVHAASAHAGPGRARPEAAPPRTGEGAGQPIVLTDATFDQTIRNSRQPVLVDFWADWCGPCKMIAPAVAQLAREFAGRAVVAKLNVDENPQTAGRFGIMSIPTLLIFRNGRVVDQIVGAQPIEVLRQRLARQVG